MSLFVDLTRTVLFCLFPVATFFWLVSFPIAHFSLPACSGLFSIFLCYEMPESVDYISIPVLLLRNEQRQLLSNKTSPPPTLTTRFPIQFLVCSLWSISLIDMKQQQDAFKRNQSLPQLHFRLFFFFFSLGHINQLWALICWLQNPVVLVGPVAEGRGAGERKREGPTELKRERRRRKLTETKDDCVKRNGFNQVQVNNQILSIIECIYI